MQLNIEFFFFFLIINYFGYCSLFLKMCFTFTVEQCIVPCKAHFVFLVTLYNKVTLVNMN